MTVILGLGFTDLDDGSQKYALQLSDTILVGQDKSTLLTEGTKSPRDTLFFLNDEDEVEEKKERKPPVAPRANGSPSKKTAGTKVLRTQSRRAARDEVHQTATTKLIEHQKELRDRLQEEGLRRFLEEGAGQGLAKGVCFETLKLDILFRELSFEGVPFRTSVRLQPTTECLVHLTDPPFLVVMLSEIEIASLERVQYGLKQFDLVLIFQDFTKTLLHINSIQTSESEAESEDFAESSSADESDYSDGSDGSDDSGSFEEDETSTIACDGLIDSFEGASGVVLANACGPCISQWDSFIYSLPVTALYNRNFTGRNNANPATHAFVASPNIVTALAFAGCLTFNPLADELVGSDGNPFRFEDPSGYELPPYSYDSRQNAFQTPTEDRVSVRWADGRDLKGQEGTFESSSWRGGFKC
ncbi:hypothetical protein NP233_g3836 [Leucocoprinus birnbaumii]|uniref:FACT complex subunit n=1 Tax=Leucocoprinus birnbaumii TaxID=56174 RepID=A0AAD5YW41_9AGAR|nr:hypothetical protein NP233_g3836 [Leucocoprinus birnbaumii]